MVKRELKIVSWEWAGDLRSRSAKVYMKCNPAGL